MVIQHEEIRETDNRNTGQHLIRELSVQIFLFCTRSVFGFFSPKHEPWWRREGAPDKASVTCVCVPRDHQVCTQLITRGKHRLPFLHLDLDLWYCSWSERCVIHRSLADGGHYRLNLPSSMEDNVSRAGAVMPRGRPDRQGSSTGLHS